MTASIAGLDQIEIDIAPGSGPGDDPSTFIWERAGSRRTAADIVIKAGRDDEASRVEAGSLSLTMDDRDLNLSPRNVMGQWYGRIGRGTPIRVRWNRTADDFTRTAVAGGWGTNADGFSWTVSNATYMATDGTRAVVTLPTNNASLARLVDAGSPDVEVVWSFSVPTAPTGFSAQVGGLLRYASSASALMGLVELTPAGNVAVRVARLSGGVFQYISDGVNVTTATTNQKIWGRARAEGGTVMVKAWTGVRADEPDTWHVSTQDDDAEGAAAGLFVWRQNSNAGTYTIYVDDFELVNTLWVGSVPEWAPRWPDKSGADTIAPVTGAGVMRGLSSTEAPLVESPLRRQQGSLPYASIYVPLEDEAGATSAGSGISWGARGSINDVTFAGDDTLPGASTSAVLNTAGVSWVSVGGAYPPSMDINAASGTSTTVLFKCAAAVPAERTLLDIRTVGTVYRWEVYVNGSSYGFRGYSEDGVLLTDAVATYGGVIPTDWVAIELETVVSGGTVTATLTWRQVGSTDYFFTSDTHSGVSRRVISVVLRAVADNMAAGHLWAGDDALPFVDATFRMASNGYIGEAASDRVARLCEEAGLPVAVLAGDSEPMGAQRPGTLLALLRECEDADLGVLYERGTSLGYRSRVRRYRPDVSLALDWAAGDLDEDPQPQDDDQRLKNYVTVDRPGGSFSVASDTDSIAAAGPKPLKHTANIESDDRLDDFASWLLSQGVDDQLRWPRIQINLVAHPELIPAWLSCSIGSRVTIDNCPIPGVVIDLIIEGFTETINVDTWIVEMSCSPASWWNVGRYDDSGGLSKYQLRTGTTNAGYAAGVTTIVVHTTDDDETLSQVSAYDIMIAGERIGVPIGGAGARSGSSGDWTTTLTGVTRGKNGVNKALPIGSPVKIADAARYSL